LSRISDERLVQLTYLGEKLTSEHWAARGILGCLMIL
jgi:hypothetical protein